MTPPSKQQIHQRLEALPEDVRMAFMDEKTDRTLWQIGERNHLGNEHIKTLARLTGYLILDFMHQDEFAHEIEAVLHFDSKVATTLSEQIVSGVIEPLLNDPKKFHTPEPPPSFEPPEPDPNLLTPAFKGNQQTRIEAPPPIPPVQSPPPQQPPVPSATSVPKFKRPDTPQLKSTYKPKPPAQPQPKHENEAGDDNQPPSFMLHEEKDIDPLASGDMAPLTRPHFFKSTAEKSQQEKPVAARLEIGQEEEVQQKPKIGRTKKENVRVVNYTGPFVESDPFGKMPKASAQNSEKEESEEKSQPKADEPQAQNNGAAKGVSPDNIVNLKDLPK